MIEEKVPDFREIILRLPKRFLKGNSVMIVNYGIDGEEKNPSLWHPSTLYSVDLKLPSLTLGLDGRGRLNEL